MSKTASFDQFTRLCKEPFVLALAVTGVGAGAGATYYQAQGASSSLSGPVRAGALPTARALPASPQAVQGAAPLRMAAPGKSERRHEAAIGGEKTHLANTARPTPVLPQPEFAPVAAPVPIVSAAQMPPGELAVPMSIARRDGAGGDASVPANGKRPVSGSTPQQMATPAAPVAAPLPKPAVAAARPLAGEVAPDPARTSVAVAPPAYNAMPSVIADLVAIRLAKPEPLPALAIGAQPDLATLAQLDAAPPAPPSAAPQTAARQPRQALALPAPEAAQTPAASAGKPQSAMASQTAEWTSRLAGVGGWTLRDQDETPAAAHTATNDSRAFRDAPPAARKHRLTGRGIEFALPVIMTGQQPAWVPMLIDGDQNVSVRLGDLLKLVRPMMPERAYARLINSDSAQEFMSLRQLRAQGLDLRYDAARNRLVMSEISTGLGKPKHRFAMSGDQ